MPAWATIDLQGTIRSETRLSGVRIEATIGGQQCQLLFPRLPPPGAKLSVRDHDKFRLRPPDNEGPWSLSLRWGDPSRAYLSPRLLGLRFNIAEPRRDLDAYRWRSHLLEWLAILHDELPTPVVIEEPMMWEEEEPDLTPADYYDPEKPVTLDTWRHAVLHASMEDDAPLELAFAIRAIKSFVHWDYRQAVIDAATACELTLNKVLKGLGVASNELERAPLGKQLDLARQRNVWLPPRSEQDLRDVRNDVVHRAKTPGREETLGALDAALEVVNYHSPVEAFVSERCGDHPLPEVAEPAVEER